MEEERGGGRERGGRGEDSTRKGGRIEKGNGLSGRAGRGGPVLGGIMGSTILYIYDGVERER